MKKILKRPLWFTTIKTLCFVVGTIFVITSCEKPKEYKYVWIQDGLTVTLNLYPNEKKFYSTVANRGIENGDIPRILFEDDVWIYYKMAGKTMYIRRENEDFPSKKDRYNKWLIRQHTEEILEMEYVGTLPAIPTITHYLFISQK